MTGITSSMWRDAALDRSGKRRVGSMHGARLRHGRSRRECAAQATGKKEIPLSPIAVEVVPRIDALFEIERCPWAKALEDSALIAQQKLRIAKLERQIYEQRPEH